MLFTNKVYKYSFPDMWKWESSWWSQDLFFQGSLGTVPQRAGSLYLLFCYFQFCGTQKLKATTIAMTPEMLILQFLIQREEFQCLGDCSPRIIAIYVTLNYLTNLWMLGIMPPQQMGMDAASQKKSCICIKCEKWGQDSKDKNIQVSLFIWYSFHSKTVHH